MSNQTAPRDHASDEVCIRSETAVFRLVSIVQASIATSGPSALSALVLP